MSLSPPSGSSPENGSAPAGLRHRCVVGVLPVPEQLHVLRSNPQRLLPTERRPDEHHPPHRASAALQQQNRYSPPQNKTLQLQLREYVWNCRKPSSSSASRKDRELVSAGRDLFVLGVFSHLFIFHVDFLCVLLKQYRSSMVFCEN